MTRDEIRAKVIKMITESALFREELAPLSEETTLASFDPDSLDSVELVMKIDELFNTNITDPEAAVLKTIGDIVNLVDQKLNPPPAGQAPIAA